MGAQTWEEAIWEAAMEDKAVFHVLVHLVVVPTSALNVGTVEEILEARVLEEATMVVKAATVLVMEEVILEDQI